MLDLVDYYDQMFAGIQCRMNLSIGLVRMQVKVKVKVSQ